jgi:hypothetical protein
LRVIIKNLKIRQNNFLLFVCFGFVFFACATAPSPKAEMLDFKPKATFGGNTYPHTENYWLNFVTEKGVSVAVREGALNTKTINLSNERGESFSFEQRSFLFRYPEAKIRTPILASKTEWKLKQFAPGGTVSISMNYDSTGTTCSPNEWYLYVNNPARNPQNKWNIRLVWHKEASLMSFEYHIVQILEMLNKQIPMDNVQYLFSYSKLVPTASSLSIQNFHTTQYENKDVVLIDVRRYTAAEKDWLDAAIASFQDN